MKLTKILLILLFFTLPLIHGRVFQTLGFDFGFIVSGNFEFTKAIYFNIFSGFIFLSFFLETVASFFFQRKEFRKDPNLNPPMNSSMDSKDIPLLIFSLIIITSTLFSLSPFISLIGDTEKGHTALMYLNLLGLYIILKSFERAFLNKLICTALFSGMIVSMVALKEFFFPSFEYGELSNRALGTFGHPNYLAGYLLLLVPFLCSSFPFLRERIQERVFFCSLFPFSKERIQVRIRIIIIGIVFSLFFITLLLTKSIWAFVSLLCYIITLSGIFSLKKGKKLLFSSIFILFIGIFFLLVYYFPEKLHSFLSRFYLWESTLKIIFSDPKIFFFGGGAETLPYYFDSFKVPEVYIFENFGYTADRAHNFFLDIWFTFGIFGALFFLYILSSFFKNFKNDISPIKISLLLFLLFGIFHYFSVTTYLLIVLILSFSQHKDAIVVPFLFQRKGFRYGLFFLFTLLSIIGAYYSLQLYRSQIAFASGNTHSAQEIFSHPHYLIELGKYDEAQKLEGILSEKNLKEQIITEATRVELCNSLIQNFSSAENYLYCGDIFEKLGKKELEKQYYQNGLKKLPDLWNKDSLYWNNYFIRHTITGNRFFSEKFSNISEILQKGEIPISSK